MNSPEHNLQLVVSQSPRAIERVEVVIRQPRRGSPVFRAPTLPTLHQLNSEVPFTENLRLRRPNAR